MSKRSLTHEQLLRRVEQLELQLAEKSKLKLRSQILAHVRDSILVTDVDGTVVYFNEPACALFGLEKEALRGYALEKLNPTFNLPHFLSYYTDNKHLYDQWEWTYVRPSGELIWISGQISPIYDEQGRIIGVLDISKDTTEQKRHESELRKREHQLHSLIDSQTNFLVRTDTTGRYTYANRTFLETFGLSWAQLSGSSSLQYVLEEDAKYLKEILQKCLLDPGQIFHTVVRACLPNQEMIWAEWEFVGIFNQEGEVTEIQGVGKNVTQRKKAQMALQEREQQLRKNNEELRKTNEELDRFVYSASHNLRAPLSSILGLVEILKQSDSSTDVLHLIEQSVRKLDDTVQEITNYSRNARLTVAQEPIDFEKLIEEVLSELAYLRGERPISVTYNVGMQTPFLSDSMRLKIILQNLLSNALKYYNPYHAASSVCVELRETPEALLLSVTDNGLGILPEHCPKIFDMFFRASQAVSGSGLGLYVVKEAVEKLQGDISVQSVPNEGSIFTVRLPTGV